MNEEDKGIRVCLHCGKTFVPKTRKNLQKYCCPYCQVAESIKRASKRYQARKQPIKCKCCGKFFITNRNHIVYCSTECSQKSIGIRKPKDKNKSKPIKPMNKNKLEKKNKLQRQLEFKCKLAKKYGVSYGFVSQFIGSSIRKQDIKKLEYAIAKRSK